VTTTVTPPVHRSRARSTSRSVHAWDLWYLGAVITGAVLIVTTALRQPFNQNELLQIGPYGSDSVAAITSGTRQPPLDPLLGGILQHLLGVGQLQQRLVPVLCGVGTLVVLAGVLRRLRLGGAGAFALWLLATAPLLVRYSAYTRPYALPLFLMVLFVYAAQRWIETRRPAWLCLVALAAALLPLARVPEPMVFLATSAAVLCWLGLRHRMSWSQAGPVAAVAVAAIAAVGYPMFRALAAKASGYFDPSPSGVVDRFPRGVHEILTGLLPLLGAWFPWWPVTLLLLATTLALPSSRRILAGWWFFWPFLAAPVVFALAYHFVNPASFEILPYRSRAAYFFAVPYALIAAALAMSVARMTKSRVPLRLGATVLLGAVLLTQLPKTADVLLHNDAPDFGLAAEVLETRVPPAGVVLYDRPAPAPQSRMGFLAPTRYLSPAAPTVLEIEAIARHPRRLPPGAQVYVLVNGQCAEPGYCQPTSSAGWHERLPGWRVARRFDRFMLYEPVAGQAGRTGAMKALRRLGERLGPELGYVETDAATALLNLRGREDTGRRLRRSMFAGSSPLVDKRIREKERASRLNPFDG
jgi:hypothetical protein